MGPPSSSLRNQKPKTPAPLGIPRTPRHPIPHPASSLHLVSASEPHETTARTHARASSSRCRRERGTGACSSSLASVIASRRVAWLGLACLYSLLRGCFAVCGGSPRAAGFPLWFVLPWLSACVFLTPCDFPLFFFSLEVFCWRTVVDG